jgi:hypothetical protein
MAMISLTQLWRKTVVESVRKPNDKPLDAPVIPVKMQVTLKRIFTPNRSLKTPPNRPIKMPAKFVTPQTVPIWTRLRPKSSEISLKRGGRQATDIVDTKAAVVTVSPKMNHR